MIHVLNPAGLTPLHLAVDFNRCSTEQVDVIRHLFDVIPHDLVMEALTKKTHTPGSPVKNNLSAYQYHEYTRQMSHDQGERISSANKIREILEHNYLRKVDPGSASRCLSLPGESRGSQFESYLKFILTSTVIHFWFDLGPKSKVFEKDFEKDFSHYRLNSTLQYVAFPQVSVISSDSGEKSSAETTGRTDMLFFSRWLEKRKHVDRILTVIVDDLKQPSHSDEVVEKALESFKVEILDWRKVDMCPQTICRIGSHIHTLHLYWSGRNSVLRGWCEAKGLAKLSRLQRVYLHVHEVCYPFLWGNYLRDLLT